MSDIVEMIEGLPFSLPQTELTVNSKQLLYAWIDPGTFMMGSTGDKSEYIHNYEKPFKGTISCGYWLGQYPVTQAQWQVVMNSNPSQHQSCPDCPIETINREQALSYCNKLNGIFAKQLPSGYRFSLPTEMHWEYASRAGTQMKYYNGNDSSNLHKIAWYEENSPQPVGEKEPNAWGLYDMLGNVWEWCYDFATAYPSEPATDWIGKGHEQHDPVGIFRGGSFLNLIDGSELYCSTRGYTWADIKVGHHGFHVCLRRLND